MTTHEFFNPGCGNLDVLVLCERGLNEFVQDRILKLFPPCGIGNLPGFLLLKAPGTMEPQPKGAGSSDPPHIRKVSGQAEKKIRTLRIVSFLLQNHPGTVSLLSPRLAGLLFFRNTHKSLLVRDFWSCLNRIALRIR